MRQAGGWHHTNDLGRIEADGSLTFVGPKGRLIKSAAENIYPAEVEACLRSHPAVADAAIIGVPDPKWGQNVTAVVVLAEGQTATADDIIGHCRAADRLVQEAQGASSSSTPCPARASPSTTTRWTSASAAAATRAPGPEAPPGASSPRPRSRRVRPRGPKRG